MSLSDAFNPKTSSKTKAKRPAPFSLRLSADERTRLLQEANGAPLGGYIKAKLLATPSIRSRRTGLAVEDRKSLAQLLALLGQSRLASNLNQLAHAANIGALPVTPDIEESFAPRSSTCASCAACFSSRWASKRRCGHDPQRFRTQRWPGPGDPFNAARR